MWNRIKSIVTATKNDRRVYKDDSFILSYPKSGNTWVRFILANLIYGNKNQIDFHSAKDFIPELEVHIEEAKNLKRPRILKSHSVYDPKFRNVIYIVRDVRDVYISYYHYMKKKLDPNVSIEDFIKSLEDTNKSWSFHVRTWLKNKPENFLIVKYEDLLDDTANQVKRMISFLNLKYSDDEIKLAIEKSSLKSMKAIEQKFGRPFLSEEDRKRSTAFVRKGEKEQWKEELSTDIIKLLENNNSELLSKFNYL